MWGRDGEPAEVPVEWPRAARPRDATRAATRAAPRRAPAQPGDRHSRCAVSSAQGGRHGPGRPRRAVETRRTGGRGMVKIWSELPVARLKEQVADVATAVWLVFWGGIIGQLYAFLASFAE